MSRKNKRPVASCVALEGSARSCRAVEKDRVPQQNSSDSLLLLRETDASGLCTHNTGTQKTDIHGTQTCTEHRIQTCMEGKEAAAFAPVAAIVHLTFPSAGS